MLLEGPEHRYFQPKVVKGETRGQVGFRGDFKDQPPVPPVPLPPPPPAQGVKKGFSKEVTMEPGL